jgi:hypothetical protein
MTPTSHEAPASASDAAASVEREQPRITYVNEAGGWSRWTAAIIGNKQSPFGGDQLISAHSPPLSRSRKTPASAAPSAPDGQRLILMCFMIDGLTAQI